MFLKHILTLSTWGQKSTLVKLQPILSAKFDLGHPVSLESFMRSKRGEGKKGKNIQKRGFNDLQLMYYIHQKRVEALNWNLIELGLGSSLEMKNPILELENPIIDWKLIEKSLKLEFRLFSTWFLFCHLAGISLSMYVTY